MLKSYVVEPPKLAYAMHRNDFLVKSNEYWLKEKYTHSYPDTLYYMLIDGEFRGAVIGSLLGGEEAMELYLLFRQRFLTATAMKIYLQGITNQFMYAPTDHAGQGNAETGFSDYTG